jgi:hypothetical protein
LTESLHSQAGVSLFLLLLILTVFVLPSIGFERNHLKLYGDIAFSVLLVFGTVVAWEQRGLFALTACVSLVAIAARWLSWWNPGNAPVIFSEATGFAAVLTIMTVILWQVFRPGPVTAVRIQGAIAVYLGIAVGWAHAYHIVAILVPGSFQNAVEKGDFSHVINWLNYSFGMLTTVGYDRIVAVHPIAYSLRSAEAVTGQLYLAVLVARLVSLQVSGTQSTQSKDKTES